MIHVHLFQFSAQEMASHTTEQLIQTGRLFYRIPSFTLVVQSPVILFGHLTSTATCLWPSMLIQWCPMQGQGIASLLQPRFNSKDLIVDSTVKKQTFFTGCFNFNSFLFILSLLTLTAGMKNNIFFDDFSQHPISYLHINSEKVTRLIPATFRLSILPTFPLCQLSWKTIDPNQWLPFSLQMPRPAECFWHCVCGSDSQNLRIFALFSKALSVEL